MPIYHERLLPDGRACNRPFVQVRCVACGKVVGWTERDEASPPALVNPMPSVRCSPSCIEAAPCDFERYMQVREERREEGEARGR